MHWAKTPPDAKAPIPPRHPERPKLRVDPAIIAANFEKMRQGHKTWRARRAAIMATLDNVLDAAQLRRAIPNRYLEIAFMHLSGLSDEQIKDAMGYKHRHAIKRVRDRPDVSHLIDAVRAEQLKRIIAGEFGVRAQARAAAPTVMRRMIEKAGAIEDGTGTPVGMATKDADAIRAGDMVLTVSGDKVERHEHLHGHALLGTMSPVELRRYADTGEWPDRLRHVGEALAQRRAQPVLPSPEPT